MLKDLQLKIKEVLQRRQLNKKPLTEGLNLKGVVSVHAYDRSGRTILKQTANNLLMYNERAVIIDLLGGINTGTPTYADDLGRTPGGNRAWLKWFGVGTDNTATSRSQINLLAPALLMEIAEYGDAVNTGDALSISLTIPFDDAGGPVDTELNTSVAITEVGLYTIGATEDGLADNFLVISPPPTPTPNGEVLFSRQVHPPITKTSSVQIDYNYSIYVT